MRAIGADVVIAGYIECHCRRAQGLSAPALIGRVMQTENCLLAAPEMAETDVLIAPGVKVSGMGAKDEQQAAIEAGYEAGRGRWRVLRAGRAARAPWSWRERTVGRQRIASERTT